MIEEGSVSKRIYPTAEQWKRWRAAMKDGEFSTTNEFLIRMIEAGIHNWQDHQQVVSSRSETQDALEAAHERIDRLEKQLYNTDHAMASRFLSDNPHADFDALIEHIQETTPERMTRFLESVDSYDGSVEEMSSLSLSVSGYSDLVELKQPDEEAEHGVDTL